MLINLARSCRPAECMGTMELRQLAYLPACSRKSFGVAQLLHSDGQ